MQTDLIILGASILVPMFGGFAWLYGVFDKRFDKVDERFEKVDKRFEQVDERFRDIDKEFKEIRTEIHKLQIDVTTLKSEKKGEKNIISHLLQSFSPVSLSPAGQEAAADLDAYNVVERNWGRITEALKDMKSLNPYDIQEYCFNETGSSPERFLDDEAIDTIKTYAFNKGYNVVIYYQMFGLIIRDRYFEEKQIPLSKIDDNDPNNPKK